MAQMVPSGRIVRASGADTASQIRDGRRSKAEEDDMEIDRLIVREGGRKIDRKLGR